MLDEHWQGTMPEQLSAMYPSKCIITVSADIKQVITPLQLLFFVGRRISLSIAVRESCQNCSAISWSERKSLAILLLFPDFAGGYPKS